MRCLTRSIESVMQPTPVAPGDQFGHLTVVRELPPGERKNYHRSMWCRCVCGREKEIQLSSLRKGVSKSCGCGGRGQSAYQHENRNQSYPKSSIPGIAERCASGKEYQRRLALWQKYRMTLEDYEEKLEAQGGGCAICHKPPPEYALLHVDHDHECCPGKYTCGRCIRGILCYYCNGMVGRIEGDRLAPFFAYLDTWKVSAVAAGATL